MSMIKALADVADERKRQVVEEGWSHEHDDKHDPGVLAGAAAAYALNAGCILHPQAGDPMEEPPHFWMWEKDWWKPNMGDNPRKDLVKAAALLIAEIEKLDRAASAKIDKATDSALKALYEVDDEVWNEWSTKGVIETHDGDWVKQGDGLWHFKADPNE